MQSNYPDRVLGGLLKNHPLHQDPEVGHTCLGVIFFGVNYMQNINISKALPEYMAAQIEQFIREKGVKVLKPKKHNQSARAFPRGGRGSIWYNKQIKGTK